MDQQKINFRNLDVLRFLAATIVVAGHAFQAWDEHFGYLSFLQGSKPSELNKIGKLVMTFINNLGIGVDVFFIISGFLITYLLLKEKEETGTISIFKFYIRRTLRIWPLYFLLIAAGPFLVWFNETESPNYLYNILFINNFHAIQSGKWIYPFNHFWSICVEEHFYLVWPFIIAFIPNKKLPFIFVLLILASIFFRFFAYYTQQGWICLYAHTLSRADVMVIGGLIAYWHYASPLTIHIPRNIRLVLYITFLFFFSIESVNDWDSAFLAALKKFFYIAFIAFGFCNYLFNPDAFFNFTTKNILHYLGKISYGIYMYGSIVIPFCISIEQLFIPTSIHHIMVFLLLNFALTILLSILSYEFFEKYFLRLKSHFEIIKTSR